MSTEVPIPRPIGNRPSHACSRRACSSSRRRAGRTGATSGFPARYPGVVAQGQPAHPVPGASGRPRARGAGRSAVTPVGKNEGTRRGALTSCSDCCIDRSPERRGIRRLRGRTVFGVPRLASPRGKRGSLIDRSWCRRFHAPAPCGRSILGSRWPHHSQAVNQSPGTRYVRCNRFVCSSSRNRSHEEQHCRPARTLVHFISCTEHPRLLRRAGCDGRWRPGQSRSSYHGWARLKGGPLSPIQAADTVTGLGGGARWLGRGRSLPRRASDRRLGSVHCPLERFLDTGAFFLEHVGPNLVAKHGVSHRLCRAPPGPPRNAASAPPHAARCWRSVSPR